MTAVLFEASETVISPRHGAVKIIKMVHDPLREGQANWSRRCKTEEQKVSTVLGEVFAS